MASAIYFIFLLCLVTRATFSLTKPLDAKTVDISHSVREQEEESISAVFDAHLRSDEDAEHVLSLKSFKVFLSEDLGEEKLDRRVKRHTMRHGKCPADRVKVGSLCVTKKAYKKLQEGEAMK